MCIRPNMSEQLLWNAGDEVKAAVGKVATSNEEEGLARAIELYVLAGGG